MITNEQTNMNGQEQTKREKINKHKQGDFRINKTNTEEFLIAPEAHDRIL